MKDKTKESKDIIPSATEDCADVTSRYERYKKENKKSQFPPIKSTGHIPVAVPTPKHQPSNKKTPPHAREHASAKQRFSDEHQPEDDA